MYKPIPGFPKYVINESGKIFCLGKKKIFLKPRIEKGYYTVGLWNQDRKKCSKLLHSLVALVFLGERPKGYDVNHKDCNRLNNHVSNLEYCTRKYNIQHAMKTSKLFNRGEKHGNAKLTENQVKEILSFKGILSGKEVAKNYSIHFSTVYYIWEGKLWKHMRKYEKTK